MCGIYGILQRSGKRFDPSVIDDMGRAQQHRGPDDSGFYADGALMFGMQRLAIIDVAGGHQPIANEDDTVTAICNGEIYNFRELRRALQAQGHKFSTGSDSEVIVHLYEEHGTDFVRHLSGMFALAVWDSTCKRLLLARDRLGIKPLYIAANSSYLAFSSELKSVLQIPGFERKVDPAALQEYLALGYVPAPLSMLEGIEKLPPGTLLVADQNGITQRQYWQITDADPQQKSLREWTDDIAETLESAVVSQMVSDVPLGAFLSGGIDSSAVVAYMAKNSDIPVKTYSIGFDTGTGGGYYNELPFARQVAERFQTDHHEIVVKPDVTQLLPELLWHMDEPVADAAFITTFLVSKFARQDVTVILSGVGGDELFGGYRRYWSEHLVRSYRRIPSVLRKSVLQPIGRALPSDRHSRWLDWSRLAKGFLAGAEMDSDARYEEFMRVFKSADLERVLDSAASPNSDALRRAFGNAAQGDPLRRLIDVDLMTQLPDDLLMLTDRMSMATSLECRVPLLDDQLLDLANSMPSDLKVRGTKLKYALKQSLRGILPDEIIDRKKRGFGAPIGGWFKNELSGFLDGALSEERVNERGIFDWTEIERIKASHRENREDYTDHLLSLMNFELWSQLYLDGDSQETVSARLAEAQAA
ncbi:MAG: asparagine synthase (glutamine-hydrolyzing) [Woeseiaceae bacterium]|nr:asparagine synthase (glutamine-hydrolyzing) [Woeseiaceae bacterium]